MTSRQKTSFKVRLAISIAGIFVMLVTFGAAITMRMDAHGMTARCPMVGMTKSFCVDVAAHLQAWQQMFTATSTNAFAGLLGVVAMILVAVTFSFASNMLITQSSGHIRARGDPEKRLFDYQQAQFSNGIQNPKIF